jgi:hypothetical protein
MEQNPMETPIFKLRARRHGAGRGRACKEESLSFVLERVLRLTELRV